VNQAQALRALQAGLQLRLDAIYGSLPPRVRAVLAKHVTADGVLTPVGAALAIMELRRLLDLADERAAPIIAQGAAAAAILAEQADPNPHRAWLLAAGFAAAAYLIGTRLRLRDGRDRTFSQVETVLTGAASSGADAGGVIDWLARHVNPWYAPRRDAAGVLRRAGRGNATATANPGQAASAARATMLTETSLAHGTATIGRAIATPGGLVRWNLAREHTDADECDDKSVEDVGYGPGLYPPHEVPVYPSHPRCQCWLEMVMAADLSDEAA
jgi:hypothetical protein